MLRVVWMCFAMMLAPVLVHADMGLADMDDMGLADMDDMGADLNPADMDDMGPDIPEPSYSIEGIVSLEDATNFSGTLVKLSSGDTEFQATTNISGSFSILEVPRGIYDLEVSRDGYLTLYERVNLQASYNLEVQLLLFSESPVVIEVVSVFSPIDLTLSGSETIKESLTTSGGVAVWEGVLHRGLWEGGVAAEGANRQFQIEVGKSSEPISLRVFLDESPTPLVHTETGCGCTTSSADSSWVLLPLMVLVGWVRRRWVS